MDFFIVLGRVEEVGGKGGGGREEERKNGKKGGEVVEMPPPKNPIKSRIRARTYPCMQR